MSENMTTEQKLEIAIQGLRDVVDPIAQINREMKEGYTLDGLGAMHYKRDLESYRKIALQTLKKLRRKP